MSELVVRSLMDLVSFIVDNRGRSCPVAETGFPLIATNCVLEGRREVVFQENVRYVDDETRQTWFRAHPEPGDVLLVCKGNAGRVAVVPDPVPYCIAQDMVALRADRDIVDPLYLYYRLASRDVQERIAGMHVGSLIPHFKKGDFKNLIFSIHADLGEQSRIAAVLGSLDDLIELNRASAEAQCALVSAVFKQRFAERELSLPVREIADVVDCLHSKKPDRVAVGSNVLVQLNNIRDNGLYDPQHRYLIDDADFARWSKKFHTQPWDCVITNVGRIGAVSRIPDGVSAAIGRNMTGIRAKCPERDGAFLIAALLSEGVRAEIDARTDSGTIMNALNVRSIPHLRLPNVEESERQEFQAWAEPLLLAADECEAEVNRVTRIRDELLPLLMAGRVRVPEPTKAA